MTREEAIHDIEECVLPHVGGISLRMAIDDMKEMDRLSKAEPVLIEPERPHGEWIFHKYDKDYECSNCHARFDRTQIYTEKRFENALWAKMKIYNFCPHCGTKMVLKESINEKGR